MGLDIVVTGSCFSQRRFCRKNCVIFCMHLVRCWDAAVNNCMKMFKILYLRKLLCWWCRHEKQYSQQRKGYTTLCHFTGAVPIAFVTKFSRWTSCGERLMSTDHGSWRADFIFRPYTFHFTHGLKPSCSKEKLFIDNPSERWHRAVVMHTLTQNYVTSIHET